MLFFDIDDFIMKNKNDNKYFSSNEEVSSRDNMKHLHDICPIPPDQFLDNIGLFIDSKKLSRILFLDFLYRQIIDLQGVIFDLGTRWGQNAAVFSSLRGIYEPFNRHRKIIAFDTFSGFPSVSEEDGSSDLMEIGNVSTTENYEEYLSNILSIHQKLNPLSHIQKNEIVKGDSSIKLEEYLEKNPHSIISLAYFDFDIYTPTKKCLELIIPRLTKGSVLGFDELNDPDSPGETIALMEAVGLTKYSIKRFRYASRVSYLVIE